MNTDSEQHAPDSLVRRVFTRPDYFMAFGFGSGLVPGAPGTAGSLVGLILFWALGLLEPVAYIVIVAGVVAAGIGICGRVSRHLDVKDPGGIVLDEIAGMGIALFLLPPGWYWLVAAFLLFRLFDIAKPWPVGWLDRNLAGGTGIMLDDVAAGLYTLAALQIGHLFVGMVV